jgi:hypothetical protein
MLQKIDINLKKELNNTRNKQSRLADIIISKENELKLLYEKKTKYKQNSEVAKKNKEILQSEFISIQKKLINKKKEVIDKLIEYNKKKDKIFINKKEYNDEQLLKKDQKIKFYQAEYMELANHLYNTKKKYNLLKKNLINLELDKTEILKKVLKLNNSINHQKNVEIKPQNIKVNKIINVFEKANKIEEKMNDYSDKADLDKTISKIFQK